MNNPANSFYQHYERPVNKKVQEALALDFRAGQENNLYNMTPEVKQMKIDPQFNHELSKLGNKMKDYSLLQTEGTSRMSNFANIASYLHLHGDHHSIIPYLRRYQLSGKEIDRFKSAFGKI